MQQTPIIPQSHQPGPQLSPPQQVNTGPNRGDNFKSILSTVLLLIAAPLVALVLTSFVFQSYQVDGPSMETTLQDGDRLVVLKTGKTWSSIVNEPYVPKRGEIIIFNRSDTDGQPVGNKQLIKRVIGLPGDRVVVKNGNLTVYNAEFPDGFNPDKAGDYQNQVTATTPGNVDITVPPGEVFVSGDNRTNSHDSRSFGTVPADDIVGVLALRIYPFGNVKSF